MRLTTGQLPIIVLPPETVAGERDVVLEVGVAEYARGLAMPECEDNRVAQDARGRPALRDGRVREAGR